MHRMAQSRPCPCPVRKASSSPCNGTRNGNGRTILFRVRCLQHSARRCAKEREMLKIIPPFWMFIFLAIAGAVSAVVSFPRFAVIPLGIALVALGVGTSFWGFGLFARKGTEIAPTSETNKLLVESGPYRFTRNPMYLG